MTTELEIRFRPREDWPSPPASGEAVLEAADASDADRLSQAVLENGSAALASGGTDSSILTIFAPSIPVFDDLLALWLLTRAPSESSPRPEAATALAEYAGACRQGLDPGTAPVDESPRAIFEEIKRQSPDLADAAQAASFRDRSFALFEYLAGRIAEGVDLFGAGIFEGTSAFREEIAMLRRDRDVYLEDRDRGRRFAARVPSGTSVRDCDLLWLEEPASNRFADWARSDPESPQGKGFGMLAVRLRASDWVLSTDPALRLRLSDLAARFDEAEARARGIDSPQNLPSHWYDGARHRGTLVASPHGGTILDAAGILAVLRRTLALRPADPTGGLPNPGRFLGPAGVAAALLLGVWLFQSLGGGPDGIPHESETRGMLPPAGDKDDGGVVLEDVFSPRTLYGSRHALIVGIDRYADRSIAPLDNAVNDAQAIASVLVDELGYDPSETHVLINEQATLDGIERTLETIQRAADADDSFLLFWAGHGEDHADARERAHGYLIPYDGTLEAGASTRRNLAMRALQQDWLPMNDARHKLVVVDTCFSGLLGQTRSGGATASLPQQYAKKSVTCFLTAGSSDERVLDGHGKNSLFTEHFLEELRSIGSHAMVSNLATRLRLQVASAAELLGYEQSPRYTAEGDGEFFFVRGGDED